MIEMAIDFGTPMSFGKQRFWAAMGVGIIGLVVIIASVLILNLALLIFAILATLILIMLIRVISLRFLKLVGTMIAIILAFIFFAAAAQSYTSFPLILLGLAIPIGLVLFVLIKFTANSEGLRSVAFVIGTIIGIGGIIALLKGASIEGIVIFIVGAAILVFSYLKKA